MSGWSSDWCSSYLVVLGTRAGDGEQVLLGDDLDIFGSEARDRERDAVDVLAILQDVEGRIAVILASPCLEQVEQAIETDRRTPIGCEVKCGSPFQILLMRSEEHTSELQSLMRISYAVFCLNKKQTTQNIADKKVHH